MWTILDSGSVIAHQSSSDTDTHSCPANVTSWTYISSSGADIVDCSLDVSEDPYTALDLTDTDLTGTVSSTLDAASEAVDDEGSNCCVINTNEAIELASPLCRGDEIQPTRFGLEYRPNGATNGGRNVYESTTGGEYVWYSSDIESWIAGPTVGDLTDAAIVQGSLGYCPNVKRANIYVYSSQGWVEDCQAYFQCKLSITVPWGR